MGGIQELIYKLGLPSRFDNITLLLNASSKQNIEQTMQTTIGRIYGMSVYCDTVTPDTNLPLITSAQAMSLYLTFVKGKDGFFGPTRLDDMNMNPVGVPTLPAKKYLEVNIPGFGFKGYPGIDLDKSFIQNPTLITGVTVILNFWYIDAEVYRYLINCGYVGQDGIITKVA